MSLRIVRWIAVALTLAVLGAWGAFWLGRDGINGAVQSAGTMASAVQVGGPFQLVDHTGKPVTDTDYRGRWMLVYFGYTFCPDICPTELQTMVTALGELGPLASRVVPLFITVDPERDTAAHLAEYVQLFDERLIGLTGTPAQIAAAAKAYRVYYAKATPKDSTTYLMDHSSFIYLMGPDGTLRALFRMGTKPQELAEALRARITAGG
ncbi:SCO family protein [Rhodovastum atsumiense]|uniref:Redoxin domain-containing protein n=1 Tax=Rhodovastum atsumiense TaxID=504468 RepID=A0A5M6J1Y0_9PROT|nr:SCO family protein [Rhodovastum atsumiense]KAA5614616.1 redoxin domain-containing protein [Rhodovastum atsumiense]